MEGNKHTHTHTHTHARAHTHARYQKQLYIDVKFTRGKYCEDIVIKNREFFLVNTVSFS